jgi:uncharacterized protein (TIGR03000 family)
MVRQKESFPMIAFRVSTLLALVLLATPNSSSAGDKPGQDKEGKDDEKKVAKEAKAQPAEIVVQIPAQAKLTIDDYETSQTGEVRRFLTPPLTPGWRFKYTLRATWKDGEHKIVRMAVASVQAGKETTVDLRQGSKDASSSQIVYVPTPQKVVDKMLEMAAVTKDDVVFDLGCGDGRVVISAARKYGARGIGVDIDPRRVQEARANLRKEKVEKLVEIRHGDALKVADLSRATVVVTYMLPEFMEKLRPILRKHLKPGTRIVAHDYPVPEWEPEDTATIPRPDGFFAHTLFLWRMPERPKE